MQQSVALVVVDREELPSFIGSVDKHKSFRSCSLDVVKSLPLLSKQVAVGYWGGLRTDPFPDFILVNDADSTDTYAWIAAFLNGFAPITQWCRILLRSNLMDIPDTPTVPNVRGLLGVWVGMILAEHSLSSANASALKDASGNATISSSSFAAGRSHAVWGSDFQFDQIAQRFDDIVRRFPSGNRSVPASKMLPIWKTVAQQDRRIIKDRGGDALLVFRNVFAEVGERHQLNSDNISDIAREVGKYLDLAEVERCAVGPQSNRVQHLDALGSRLASETMTVAHDAILGFAASLIDQGAAVLPDLLKRYQLKFPTAAVWSGAFAGAWAPARVMSDFGGLGRIVAKELQKPSDIYSKPTADIAYEELSRWIGKSAAGSISIRGLSNRALNVELVPGVTLPTPMVRNESQRAEPVSVGRQHGMDFDHADQQPISKRIYDRTASPSPTTLAELMERVQRLENSFEKHLASLQKKSTGRTAGKATSK